MRRFSITLSIGPQTVIALTSQVNDLNAVDRHPGPNRCSLVEIDDGVDVAGGFVDVEDFAVNGDEDGAVRRRGELDEEVRRERMAVFEDDFGKNFAADTFLLPAGREVAAVGNFFGKAGGKAF